MHSLFISFVRKKNNKNMEQTGGKCAQSRIKVATSRLEPVCEVSTTADKMYVYMVWYYMGREYEIRI